MPEQMFSGAAIRKRERNPLLEFSSSIQHFSNFGRDIFFVRSTLSPVRLFLISILPVLEILFAYNYLYGDTEQVGILKLEAGSQVGPVVIKHFEIFGREFLIH